MWRLHMRVTKYTFNPVAILLYQYFILFMFEFKQLKQGIFLSNRRSLTTEVHSLDDQLFIQIFKPTTLLLNKQ